MKNTRNVISLNINVKSTMPQLLWVLKARSKDQTRLPLNYMLFDDNGITCTDGARLHQFIDKKLLPKLENGLYDVIITTKNITFLPIEDMEFPNYQEVLPHYDDVEPLNISLNTKEDTNYVISSVLIRIYRKFGNCVNYAFLEDLAKIEWHVKAKKDNAVEFKSESFYALILPIILREEG